MTAKAIICVMIIKAAARFLIVFGYMFAMWYFSGLDD
jgi:hypothetical protein